MSDNLGKTFKRSGKTVRYLYKGGKKAGKILVTRVEADAKRGSKRMLVAGVTYYVLHGIDRMHGSRK